GFFFRFVSSSLFHASYYSLRILFLCQTYGSIIASLSSADTVLVFGGIGVCTLLAILSYFSRIRLVEYGMLTLALLSATSGSFLLALQLMLFMLICYFCLGATVSFYVIFLIIAGRFFLGVVRRHKEA
nr:hypothetical protein [Clostridia bacterium]